MMFAFKEIPERELREPAVEVRFVTHVAFNEIPERELRAVYVCSFKSEREF
jgi:hypothetical protein